MKRPAVNEIIQDPMASYEALREAIKTETHCSMPGIVKSFDPATQTATIQPAIRSKRYSDSGMQMADLPLLANVPVYFPGGGQYALTMPVQPGDECLVVFADSCIDAWFQSGGVQNQIDFRSHDLSDGFAFVGFRSRPKAIENFPMDNPSVIGDMDALKGPAGKSAYQLWLDAGNSGSVEEYLQSLIGPAGAPGSDASVTKASVEGVLTGNITTHTHTPAQIGAAPASHTHTKANISDFPNALYPLRVGGVQMNFNWSGQGGQPPWLWGGSDGANMYVYNPSNFNVNHANTAGGLSSYAAVVNLIYPVGSIYMSTSATNPNSLFGGSWERYAVGRVLVGVSEGEGEFAGPGYTGGEKYHTLTVNEMPSHNHRLKAWAYQTNANGSHYYGANQNMSNDNWDGGDHITYAGNGWGHNNMQPFVSVYIWRRIG